MDKIIIENYVTELIFSCLDISCHVYNNKIRKQGKKNVHSVIPKR